MPCAAPCSDEPTPAMLLVPPQCAGSAWAPPAPMPPTAIVAETAASARPNRLVLIFMLMMLRVRVEPTHGRARAAWSASRPCDVLPTQHLRDRSLGPPVDSRPPQPVSARAES